MIRLLHLQFRMHSAAAATTTENKAHRILSCHHCSSHSVPNKSEQRKLGRLQTAKVAVGRKRAINVCVCEYEKKGTLGGWREMGEILLKK